MQTILVTGAGGYIGTTMVPMLITAGHNVIAVDTFWFGDHLPAESRQLTRLRCDVRDLKKADFRGVNAVIDLAALSNDPCGEAFAEATREINYLARVRTASLARSAGVRHYVLASSCSVYGFHTEVRDEQSRPNPLTMYASANLTAEQEILSLSTRWFTVTAMRLSTLFGASPRMRLDLVVNSMCYSAWRHGEITASGGGTQTRPLLHVVDVAHTVTRLLDNAETRRNSMLINIGSNSMNISINELAEQICDYFQTYQNKEIVVRHCGPQDLRSYKVNFSLLHKTMFWAPSLSVESALGDIIAYIEHATSEDISRCHTLDWYQHLGGAATIMQRGSIRASDTE